MHVKFYILIGISLYIYGCNSDVAQFERVTAIHLPPYLADNNHHLREAFRIFCDNEDLKHKGAYFFQLANKISDAAWRQTPITKDSLVSMIGVPDLIYIKSPKPEFWLYIYTSQKKVKYVWICDFEYDLLKGGGVNTYEQKYYSDKEGWIKPKLLQYNLGTIPRAVQ